MKLFKTHTFLVAFLALVNVLTFSGVIGMEGSGEPGGTKHGRDGEEIPQEETITNPRKLTVAEWMPWAHELKEISNQPDSWSDIRFSTCGRYVTSFDSDFMIFFNIWNFAEEKHIADGSFPNNYQATECRSIHYFNNGNNQFLTVKCGPDSAFFKLNNTEPSERIASITVQDLFNIHIEIIIEVNECIEVDISETRLTAEEIAQLDAHRELSVKGSFHCKEKTCGYHHIEEILPDGYCYCSFKILDGNWYAFAVKHEEKVFAVQMPAAIFNGQNPTEYLFDRRTRH